MIKVIIPINPEFKFYEKQVKKLYESKKEQIGDTNSFDFIKDETFFYLFVLNKEILGGIYYFYDEDKLFVNGFANRKFLFEKLYCLLWSTTWFNTDIYAEAQNRASAFCLLKCGFKRVKDNLFVLKNNVRI